MDLMTRGVTVPGVSVIYQNYNWLSRKANGKPIHIYIYPYAFYVYFHYLKGIVYSLNYEID